MITSSTFSGNSANRFGGAIYNHFATATITSSSFSVNSTFGNGGAINNLGELEITSSTFSGNSALFNGGAIYNKATLMIGASIVAGNTATTGPNCDNVGFGTLTSLGSNLSDDDSCGFTAIGDIQNSTDVNLGLLADNGGLTQTMLPGAGSDAIDAADCSLSSAQDQRGADRPDPSSTTCDIGAVEVGATVPVQVMVVYPTSGTINEGGSVTFMAVAYGPDNSNLAYAFDCDTDGSYETAGSGTGTLGTASCTFNDDGSYMVGVQVCDGADAGNCDTATTTVPVTVTNVAPVIESITTNSPVPQGQPVTIIVNATDVGINDILSYAFDCDDDGSYEVGPQAGNSADCTLDPEAGTSTIGVRVEDDDLGEATGSVEVVQTVTLCIDYATGELSAAGATGCGTGTIELAVPGPISMTFCIHNYTGELRWSPAGSCSGGERPHIVPDNGPLHYCTSLWTGKLRVPLLPGQCTAR